MKYTFYKKNNLFKLFIVAVSLVGFSSLVFSAPPGTSPVAGDGPEILDFSSIPQSKDCATNGPAANTTLTICHDSHPSTWMSAKYGFRTEGIISQGPVIAEGILNADLSQMTSAIGSDARDAIRLTTGKSNNITTIAVLKDIMGVWSQSLNNWAQGRIGRLDAEKIVLSSPSNFKSWFWDSPRAAADPYRTTSYTNTVSGNLPHIDLAGTTNIGLGNYCYNKHKTCNTSYAVQGADQNNLYMSGFGRDYVTCKDLDPAEFPWTANMSVFDFTCTETRDVPPSIMHQMYLITGYGYEIDDPSNTSNFCTGSGYSSIVDQSSSATTRTYISSDDTFQLGTYVFVDPYLEKPIRDGWHAGITANWVKTSKGFIVSLGYCASSAPSAPVGSVYNASHNIYEITE